ncbi:MAG: SpvB/TcaC N-terminal domain-containing protein [Cyclobacteriaceae bacterium]
MKKNRRMKSTPHSTTGKDIEKKLPDISEHTSIDTLTKESPSESNQISIPKLELPKGGGAIKGIDEKFKVNAANGTASLSVPLPITPGRHGFGPSLSLSYSSGGGNSPFGLGWSLDLPQISLKTDKGLPRYAGEDVFVMAGAEDLVTYLVEDGPGNWVLEERNEGEYTITRYRPRITSDHARIEMIRHPTHGTYWRVTSSENTVTLYGRSEKCRIADPEDARRIYIWMPEFSYDDKGNWMRYSYKAEDLDQVSQSLQESHRHDGRQPFANRYLKRVRYGNAEPYTPGPALSYDPSEPADDTCYYELILDYGEHDADTPAPAEAKPWPVREDPFSSYRSGFEIRTYRLCRRILMFHHFPDETNHDGTVFGNDYLVRSITLDYKPSSINDSGQAEVNYLAAVTASGYVRKGDGSYSKKSLPPLSLDYRHLQWRTEMHQVGQAEVENLPEGFGGSFQVLESEAFQVIYEQDITDPRVSHTINLKADRYGNVLQAASIAYARFSPDMSLPQPVRDEQAKTHITLTRNTYTNDAIREVDNAFGDSYRLRLLCESEVYEIRNLSKGNAFYRPEEFSDVLGNVTTEIPYLQPHSNAVERRKIEHSQSLFLKDDLSAPLNPGELEPKGMNFESYALVYTPDMLDELFPPAFLPTADYPGTDAHYVHFNGDANWWAPSGRAIYLEEGETLADVRSRFWNPIGYRDAGNAEVRISFYKNYYFLIQSTTDAVGNTTQADVFNFRTLSPVILRDANENLTAALPDELGMVKATALLGKDLDGDGSPETQLADSLVGLNEWTDDEEAPIQGYFQQADPAVIDTEAGKLLKQATSRFLYDLNAWTGSQKPAVTCGIMCETHHAELGSGQEARLQIGFEYTDGMGNLVMTKVKAEPGLAKQTTVNEDGTYTVTEVDTTPAIRWLGNGRIVLNNKGKMVKQFQPYFSVTPGYEDAPELVETGHTFILYYDSLGRHTRTLFPDKSLQEIHFDAWKKEIWDQNDMALQSEWYHERFNRLIDTELTADGKDPEKEQEAATKTAKHDSTPSVIHFDTLGRPVLTLAHNKRPDNSDEFIQTDIALDIEGNTLSVTDPRGNIVMAYRHHMLGGRAYSNSMDAGERWNFVNALGNLKRSRDSRNHTIIISYDAIYREIEKKVTGGDSGAPLDHVFEELIYGEGKPNDKAMNLRGTLWHHYDTSGKIEIAKYNQRGKPEIQVRKLLLGYKDLQDWSRDNPDNAFFTGENHQTTISYDALDRVRVKVNPDGSSVYNHYSSGGLLSRVEANIKDRRKEYVKSITYNERNQRATVIYGNDVKITHVYDKKTLRQLSVISRRKNNDLLQELHYTYDAVVTFFM